jgi:hypothetical protein
MAINYPLPLDVASPNFEKFIFRSAHASCAASTNPSTPWPHAQRLVDLQFGEDLGLPSRVLVFRNEALAPETVKLA